MSAKKTTQEFVSEATRLHEGKYDYSLVDYKGARIAVEIKCLDHGVFKCLPNSHLSRKSGCPDCAAIRRATSQVMPKHIVVQRILDAQPGVYEYDMNFTYKNKDTKIKIKCREHNWFVQSIHNHVFNKQGCPTCSKSGYDYTQPGQLYILTSDNITKVGITNLTAKRRSRQVSNSSRKLFLVSHEYFFTNGSIPSGIETILLRELRSKYSQPEEKFQGHSECFYDVDQVALLTRIEELIQEHTEAQNQEV